MKKRRALIISLSLVIGIMLVCTVVAENIYYNSLPQVFIGNTKESTLTVDHEIVGMVEFEKRTEVHTADFDFETIKLLKDDGEEVGEDWPIYSVSLDEIQYHILTRELKIAQIEKTNRSISWDGSTTWLTEDMELTYELNLVDIKNLEAEIEELKVLEEAEGIVRSQESGTIKYYVKDGQYISKNTVIYEMENQTLDKSVKWQMPQKDGNYFSVGDSMMVGLTVYDASDSDTPLEDREYEFRQINLTIDNIEFSEESQTYFFESVVPATHTLKMPDQARVDIILNYESSKEYKYVVPTSAIHYNEQDNPFIYAVESRNMPYGQEYYVTSVSVSIETELGNYTALTNVIANTNIVFGYTKILEDSMAVKLNEEEFDVID